MPLPANLEVEVSVDASAALPPGITETSIRSLVEHVLRAEGQDGWWQVGVQFLDDASMQAAHAAYMGIDTPTDIMTFPYDDEPDIVGDGAILQGRGGDLMISVERAADHAADAGWSTVDELHFLIAHGLLHILGWDDATDADRARMLERQSALLTSWDQA
jgi:probable rRNA maturation factor